MHLLFQDEKKIEKSKYSAQNLVLKFSHIELRLYVTHKKKVARLF